MSAIHESHRMERFYMDDEAEARRVCRDCGVCTCHGAERLEKPCTPGE